MGEVSNSDAGTVKGREVVTPKAVVVHRTSQRLRIKVPSKKGVEEYFDAVGKRFARTKKVERIELNSSTGSILFTGPEIDVEAIARFAAERDLFELQTAGAGRKTLAGALSGSLGGVSKKVHQFTGGEIDLPTIAFVTLLSIGVVQILRGRFGAPPWYTAFWYAFGIFTKSLVDSAMQDDAGE
jgi:hypothetical protein